MSEASGIIYKKHLVFSSETVVRMSVVIPMASRNTNETLLECLPSIQLETTGPRDHPGVSPLLIGRVIMEVVMTLVMTLVIPLFTLVITWAWAML